jgi:type IV secretory pathway TrbD component
MLEHHLIHGSLFRPVLFAGAESSAVVVEVLTAGGLLFGVGFHVATIAIAMFYVTVVHAVMVRLASKDPQISQIYLRSLAARDYYPAQSTVTAPIIAPRVSIPVGR